MNKIASARIVPAMAPPIVIMKPNPGVCDTIEYDNIAAIETRPNRVIVLLIVPSKVIL